MEPAELRRLLEDVEEAVEQGEIDRAVELCDQILLGDPDNLDARFYLADIALEEGEAEDVIQLGQEILERDADNDEARLLLAQGYLAIDDLEKTIEMCDVLLRKDPNNLDARFYMAEALLELGAAAEAAQLYESIVEENPEDAASMLGLGFALYESCQFDEAMAALQEALELDPEMADGHFFVGLILERQGDEMGARRSFKTARELDPETYKNPIKLSMAEFEKVVEDVLKSLPEKLRNYLANVPISVEELPADADLRASDPPLSPNLWGLFRGQTLAEQLTDKFAHVPSEIVLYRRNLQRGVQNREELIEEIKITLQHEIAHFLGLDEEEVAELGLE